MRTRRAVAVLGAAAFTGAALGVLPALPASASCVGPFVGVGVPPDPRGTPQAGPVVVPRTGELTVRGLWFRSGCDDTGGAGCGGPGGTGEPPLRGVRLVLEQGGSSWVLGTGDAGGRSSSSGVRWTVDLPPDLAPGPALLRAGTVEVDLRVDG